MTSSLSNRLKLVLDKLIHENQKGFLSGRYIGENTRLVYDILNYTEQMNKPGLLLLIDFERHLILSHGISYSMYYNFLTLDLILIDGYILY